LIKTLLGGGSIIERYESSINNRGRYGNLLIFGLFLIGLMVIFAYGMGNVSAANTIYVNGSSGNDSWTGLNSTYIGGLNGPKASIKNAISTVTSGGTVRIANGLYNGAKNNNITINKNMTIQGQSKQDTIIQNTIDSYIFQINSGIKVNINDLTLTQGTNPNGNGGAINNDGTLTVNSSTFTCNSAAQGGAIYNDGSLTVNNSTFTGNIETEGGAIANGGTAIVNNSTFTDNTATTGGAIANYNNYNYSLTVNNSTFTGNTATVVGGAIWTQGTVTVNNSTFTSNSANQGGAIYNEGTVTANSSTFTSNSANQGGAIYNSAGTLTVNKSTFTGNTATTTGGAITNQLTLTVNSSNFTGNSANQGGAICNYHNNNATVKYCRIYGNGAVTGNDIYNTGTMNAAYNWWGSNSGPSTNSIYGTVTVTVTPWMVTPTVTSITPKNGASNVPTNQVITIKFNEPIKAGNMNIVLQTSAGKSIATKITISGNTLTIKPTTTLSKGTKYQILLHSGCVTDLAGDNLKGITYSFTTI